MVQGIKNMGRWNDNPEYQTLIDLNADQPVHTIEKVREEPVRSTSRAPSVSIFKVPEPAQADIFSEAGKGFIAGGAIGFLIALFKLVTNDFGNGSIMLGYILYVGAAGAAIAYMRYRKFVKKGYVRIDNEQIDFYKKPSDEVFKLDQIISAFPYPGTWGKRLYIFMTQRNYPGYKAVSSNFRRYRIESGPVAATGQFIEDGNKLVQMALNYHYNERVKMGKPVAVLPRFLYVARKTHREYLLFGELIVDAEFRCDGKKVFFSDRRGSVEFSAMQVSKVRVNKVQTQHGTSKHEVLIDLDPTEPYGTIQMDILKMTHADAVAEYCKMLPGLLAKKQDMSDWM